MKYVNFVLFLLLIALQCQLWIGEGSLSQVYTLNEEVQNQKTKIETLKERNQVLEAEVHDLKYHLSALEERARIDLGMIRQGETFYQDGEDREPT